MVHAKWLRSVQQHRVSYCQEIGRVLEMAVESDKEEIARNELDCEKRTSCVI
jgi:hypothetical protein